MLTTTATSCLIMGVVLGGLGEVSSRNTEANQKVPPAPATGAISGVVRDGVTGQPIEDALVSLAGVGRGATAPLPRQRTDSRGRFIFTHLPAFGSYSLTASRQGYFDGNHRPIAGSVGLGNGEWFSTADIVLWRPAAISGTVRDEQGEPLVGIPVRALTNVRVGGRVRLAAGPATVTDDRGMYRLAGLRPGQYVIHVPSVQVTLTGDVAATVTSRTPATIRGTNAGPMTSSEPLTMMRLIDTGDGLSLLVGHFPTPRPGTGATAYPMMYYPAVRSLEQAVPVLVAYGDQRGDVDVQMMLVPTVRVVGRVTGPAAVLSKLPVRLVPVGSEELGEGAEAALTVTDALGRFNFLRVPEGNYVVIASSTQAEFSGGSDGGASSGRLLPNRANFFGSSSGSGSVQGAEDVRYTVRSASGGGATGRISLNVADEDVTDLVVPLQAGVVVSGHYLWDGNSDPPPGIRSAPLVRLEPANGDLSIGLPSGGSGRSPDNMTAQSPLVFSIRRVLPGVYVFGRSLTAANFSVESIDYGGRDMLQTRLIVETGKDITGLVVNLSSKPRSVTGFVRNGTGNVATEGTVVLFPVDKGLWRDYGLTAQLFKTAVITGSGAYRVPSPLPGEYFIAAVAVSDRQRWTDPDFLALSVRATRIKVAPGAALTQDLRLDGGGR